MTFLYQRLLTRKYGVLRCSSVKVDVTQSKLNFMFLSIYKPQIMRGKVSMRHFVPLRLSKLKRFPYKSVRTSTVRKLNSCAFHRNLSGASDEKKRDFTRDSAEKGNASCVWRVAALGRIKDKERDEWRGLKQVCALLHCALVDLFRLGLSADLSRPTLTNPWESQHSSLETAASFLAFPLS